MAFRHGVYKSEVPTSIISPTQGESGLPVITGTAPVFMGDIANVNTPKLIYTYEEAVELFGYSKDWDNYTLSEFIFSQFALYAQSPCVLINVFDPVKHSEAVSEREIRFVNGVANIGKGYFVNGDLPDGVTSYYDDEENLILAGTGTITISNLRKAKPELVTASDIIGGVNATTGEYSGLELINSVFPKFRLVPGLLGAPGWSENTGVAAVMRAKADNINGLFTCTSVVDIPCDSSGAPVYTSVPEWKNRNNYVAEREIACWPKVALDGKVYHMSTHLIGVMNKTDRNHDDVPFKSPSNELMQIDSCVNDSGQEINLSLEQCNYLNSQGIVSALNWIGGWRAWGNRTGAYPANTDPKDCFISARRMLDYLGNTFITTFWSQTDEPMSPRLIRRIVNSFNMYLNSLTAREMLLGGMITFKESDNALTDLMNGILKFHIDAGLVLPAEVIQGEFEYDPEYLKELYSALK